jgi:hypothetical protein
VVGRESFDAVGFDIGMIPLKEIRSRLMLIGDRGWFQNYKDYTKKFPGGAWQAENVIKLEKDSFWGFTGDDEIKSIRDWENDLRDKYNKPDGQPVGNQRNDPLPGFSRELDFLDVAHIAMSVFLHQTTEGEQK